MEKEGTEQRGGTLTKGKTKRKGFKRANCREGKT